MNQSISSKNNQGFGIVEVILIIAAVGILGVVGWVFFVTQKVPASQQVPASSKQTPAPSKPAEQTTTTYNDEAIGIQFAYPKNWILVKCDDRPSVLYMASDKRGLGEQDGSSLCEDGGSDFPHQVVFKLRHESNQERNYVGDLVQEITVDGKKALKYVYLATDHEVSSTPPPGLETTTFYIETSKGRLELRYNQWPKTVKDYDTSDAGKAEFVKIVESLKFL